jgi:hypothetical protein
MEFRNWFNEESFFDKIKQYVLGHMLVEQNRIVFSFPKYTDLVTNLPQYKQNSSSVAFSKPQPAMSLSAHTSYNGTVYSEKEGTTKVGGAVKALKMLSNPQWSQQKWRSFEGTIGHDLPKFAAPLGFLFEVEIYLYFLVERKMVDRDDNEVVGSIQFMKTKRKRYMSEIQLAVKDKNKSDGLFYMVQTHAKDLAEQIYNRSVKILKCSPIQCMYTGGEGEFVAQRNDPADMILYCGKQKSGIGWSVKLTSETKTHIMTATALSAYKLLGGGDEDGFREELESANAGVHHWDYFKRLNEVVVSNLEKVAEVNFTNNPSKFVFLLNDLLSGKALRGRYDTYVAVRNYTSPSMGSADWSGNIRKDFIATDDTKGKLRARTEAEVTVEVPPGRTYVLLRYKVAGGSHYGTCILFEPRIGADGSPRIMVKATNLTTDRR